MRGPKVEARGGEARPLLHGAAGQLRAVVSLPRGTGSAFL